MNFLHDILLGKIEFGFDVKYPIQKINKDGLANVFLTNDGKILRVGSKNEKNAEKLYSSCFESFTLKENIVKYNGYDYYFLLRHNIEDFIFSKEEKIFFEPFFNSIENIIFCNNIDLCDMIFSGRIEKLFDVEKIMCFFDGCSDDGEKEHLKQYPNLFEKFKNELESLQDLYDKLLNKNNVNAIWNYYTEMYKKTGIIMPDMHIKNWGFYDNKIVPRDYFGLSHNISDSFVDKNNIQWLGRNNQDFLFSVENEIWIIQHSLHIDKQNFSEFNSYKLSQSQHGFYIVVKYDKTILENDLSGFFKEIDCDKIYEIVCETVKSSI